MKTLSLFTIVGVMAAMAAVLGAESNAPIPKTQSLPRYKLEVGQELVYEGTTRFQYENGSHGTKDRTTFWVSRLNPDGSWHVVAHNESTFQQTFGKDQQEMPGQKREAFGAFDVFPDGKCDHTPENFEARGLTALFFKLPADNAQAQTCWETKEDNGKALYRVEPGSDPAPGKWVLEKTDQSIFNDIYLSTSKAHVHFDSGRGLVSKVESETTQRYGFNGEGTGLTELKSATMKAKEWMAQLDQEAETFARAQADVQAAMKQMHEAAQAKEAGEHAKRILGEAGQKVHLPQVQEQIQSQLQQLKGQVDYLVQDKEEETGVLNKPAADWETTDLDGKKRALTDFRGKVVVLDFWYRGCGWCIRAMPQIKEVAEHFQDKSVAVLGMNTDREEKDARFVADKLKLNYATLKAQGLPEKYGVRGFPTLIIIDQQGIVRARHVGYSPTLNEEVTKTINGLLAAGN